MNLDPYKALAERLDSLPNGFPATAEGVELKLLSKLFTPEEARLAASLKDAPEIPERIAARIDANPEELRLQLKGMTKRGLIEASRTDDGLAYSLMPFVVGIYEMQANSIDAELARLFETYYQQAFRQVFKAQPSFHRVIPVGESVRVDFQIQPYENVTSILDKVHSWGVIDCICRKQKALIGDPCFHPLDVCMVLNEQPGAFDHTPAIKPLTRDEASQTLHRAAKAGLVHTVSNNQKGVWYICNCCTCSCGLLRGIAEMGVANVVARSEFVNRVDADLCLGCDVCTSYCQFGALSVADMAKVDEIRCVGCGLCVLACPEGALGLERRPEDEIKPPPVNESDWKAARAIAREIETRS